MATGQLFSRTTQALFYNYKQLPVQRMLDFDFLCGWILWLPFLAFLRFTQQCRGESEPFSGRSISNEPSRRQSLDGADIIPKLNGFFTTYFLSEATRSIVFVS
ncbi:hypothetical protein Bca4012_100990 [Brassica carinata]